MKILLDRPEIAHPEQVSEVEMPHPSAGEAAREHCVLARIAKRPFRKSRGGRRKEKP